MLTERLTHIVIPWYQDSQELRIAPAELIIKVCCALAQLQPKRSEHTSHVVLKLS
jgi:hypothetical protein